MIVCKKYDRVSGKGIGSIRLTQEQFANRALNKTVVALPVQRGAKPVHNPVTQVVAEQVIFPDLSDLAVDVPENATVTYEYVVLDRDLYVIKRDLKQAVTQKFWEVIDGGMEINLGAGPIRIETTHTAMQEIDKLEARLNGTGNTQKAVTRSGVQVVFDAAAAAAIKTALEDRQAAAYAREYDLHAEIDACQTVAEAALVDINEGWPAVPEGG